MTYYQVLQIDKKASPEVIKAAYRALSMHYHPDKNPGDSTSTFKMQQINIAHSILSDVTKRADYDKTLVFIPNKAYTPPNRPHTTSQPHPKPQPKPEPEPKEETPPETKGKEWGYGLHPNYKDKQPLKTSFSNFLNNIPGGFVSFIKVVWSVIWPIIKWTAIISFYATFGIVIVIVIAMFSGGGGSHYHYDNRYNRRY